MFASWQAHLPKLHAGRQPDDFDDYRAQVAASLRRPGHAKAFSLTTHTNNDFAEARLKYQTTFGTAGTPLPQAIATTVAWYQSRDGAPHPPHPRDASAST
jgi:hypothetical protein